ncbi:MAG: PAS domain-containing sensor histidine kinase [Deltaproteobacteria bacterium]|nr:PAS domain-containing sensor histidine kinase [Deltaproteobacteria bacterium]
MNNARPGTAYDVEGAPSGGRVETMRLRLAWLLVFRGVVVTVLVATVVVLKATSDEDIFARASLALYGIAGAAYLTILGGAGWMRVFGTRGLAVVGYVQLVSDAAIASALVLMTGGVESIFVFLYSLSVLNAAIVLERRGAIVIASSATLMYAAVWVVEALAGQGLVALLPQFATNAGSFFLVAVLGGYLTGQLTRTSERLKDTEASLAQLERLNAAVLGSLPSGVLSIDDRGRVVFINLAGNDILGGGTVGAEVGTWRPELVGVGADGVTDRFEITLVDGERRRVIGGNVAPLIGAAGAGRVIVFQDLTELRRLQQEVTRAEQLAALGRVSAGLAHEVRNPLAAMIGSLHLLRSDDSRIDSDNRRMLDIVWREAERLSRLVQDFLRYARPAPPHPTAVKLSALVDETAAAVRLGLKAAKVRTDAAIDVVARCDPDQLRQVLWNLVANADAVLAAAGRSDGVITIGARAEGGVARIDIDDNGPGVAEEIRGRLFEPFFTTRHDGSGLGLATSRQLLLQNGGSIALDVAPTGGARFTVRVPLERSSAPPPVLDP